MTYVKKFKAKLISMTIFSTENLTKSYGEKFLFGDVSVGMQQGEKIGIIGKNGIGKSTFLKIVANVEQADDGNVVFNKSVRFEFLEQSPSFDNEDTILSAVLKAKINISDLLDDYRLICNRMKVEHSDKLNKELEDLTHKLDLLEAWNYENEAKKILSRLGLNDFDLKVNTLSGGNKKRVALARALISKPELLIFDEPTNHLDAESVQWLQDYLSGEETSLLFITHDRYFLDALCTKIWEFDKNKIIVYNGKYEDYLYQKDLSVQIEKSSVERNLSVLRQELEWLSRGAKARRTKAKSRIDWISVLATKSQFVEEKKIKIEVGSSFLGSRIIDAYNIGKSIAGKKLFKDFTYLAKPGDRIGIIGPNGSGKSTLLNILSGRMQADEGNIKIGENAKIAYFTQEITNLNENHTVIGSLREVAEYINVGVGKELKLTCRDMLDKFLFPRNQHASFVHTLSGGEKKRLSLIKLLMDNPNVIMMDEPTNDFDIQTLNAIEAYLDNFKGVLLLVSHDRAFLDRTVDFIKLIDENQNIREYPGNFSAYLEKKEEELKQQRALAEKIKNSTSQESNQKSKDNESNSNSNSKAKKLSFNVQRELQNLETEIPELEKLIEKLNNELTLLDGSDYEKYQNYCDNISKQTELLDQKTERWLEIQEML